MTELVARVGHLRAMLDARVLWTRAQELVAILSPVERRHRYIEAAHMRRSVLLRALFQFSLHFIPEYSTVHSVV